MTPDELKEKRERRGTWYAMERKATPAPWAVVEHRTLGTGILGSDGKAVFSQNDKWPENMELAVHCRNNFGKALEALRLAETTLMSLCGAEVYWATHRSWPVGQVRNAIRELEGVECSIEKSG